MKKERKELESYISFDAQRKTRNELTSYMNKASTSDEIASFIFENSKKPEHRKRLATHIKNYIDSTVQTEKSWDNSIKEEKQNGVQKYNLRKSDEWKEEKIKYIKYGHRIVRWVASSILIIILYSIAVCVSNNGKGFIKIPGKDTIEKFAPKE